MALPCLKIIINFPYAYKRNPTPWQHGKNFHNFDFAEYSVIPLMYPTPRPNQIEYIFLNLSYASRPWPFSSYYSSHFISYWNTPDSSHMCSLMPSWVSPTQAKLVATFSSSIKHLQIYSWVIYTVFCTCLSHPSLSSLKWDHVTPIFCFP